MAPQPRFYFCLDFVLGREGGYSDHPADRGGRYQLRGNAGAVRRHPKRARRAAAGSTPDYRGRGSVHLRARVLAAPEVPPHDAPARPAVVRLGGAARGGAGGEAPPERRWGVPGRRRRSEDYGGGNGVRAPQGGIWARSGVRSAPPVVLRGHHPQRPFAEGVRERVGEPPERDASGV